MKNLKSVFIYLSCFFYVAVSAQIQFVESVEDGKDGLKGLNKINRVAISPDGRHLYTTSGDHSVGIFSRDVAGSLRYLSHINDGEFGAESLEGANNVLVSPNGEHVYVTAFDDAAVSVFKRDVFNGSLAYLSDFKMEEEGVHLLEGLNSIAISSEGRDIYIGSFLGDALCHLSMNLETSRLQLEVCLEDGKGRVHGLNGISSLALSPDDQTLYVTAWQDGAISSYSRNPATGGLTFMHKLDKHKKGGEYLEGINSISFSPDGKYIYAGAYHSASVTVFERNLSRNLKYVMNTFEAGMGKNEGIQSVYVSPEGENVYALSFGDPTLTIYDRDKNSGKMTLASHISNLMNGKGNSGGYSIVMSANGEQLYAADYKENGLVVFDRNKTDGALSYAMALVNGQGGIEGLYGVRSLAMAPDGKYVYAAAFEDDALSVFHRNQINGRLAYQSHLKDGHDGVDALSRVSAVVISSDGRHVYSAAYGENALSVFTRDQKNGELNYLIPIRDGILGVSGLQGVYSLAMSPDGRHLYTAASGDNALGVFRREPKTGNIIYQTHFADETGDINSLAGANSVAVSPDGRNVYVTGFYDNALTVFSRNLETGCLTFLMDLKNGEGKVEGLGWVNSVTVSPDGEYVYTASWRDDAVTQFKRDPFTGKLDFLVSLKDGRDVPNGLNGATSVSVSPDGNLIYVSTWSDGGMAVFQKSPDTGELAFVTCFIDRLGDVDKLKGSFAVLISPEGEHVYLAAGADRSVSLFQSGTALASKGVEPELADDLFTFSVPGHTLYTAPSDKVQRVQIKDVSGQVIRDVDIDSQNVTWNKTSWLKPGPYMVEINTLESQAPVKMVVWLDN